MHFREEPVTPVYRQWMCEQVGCNGELLSTGESITRLSTSWKHRCGKCGHEDWADATRMMTSFQDAIAIASLLIPHLAQGMVRGNPPLRLDVRKYPPLSKNRPRIADPPTESAGKVNHYPLA